MNVLHQNTIYTIVYIIIMNARLVYLNITFLLRRLLEELLLRHKTNCGIIKTIEIQ